MDHSRHSSNHHHNSFSMRRVGKIARDCSSAMAYLASKHIVHRDLALRNVLYWKKKEGGRRRTKEKRRILL